MTLRRILYETGVPIQLSYKITQGIMVIFNEGEMIIRHGMEEIEI